MLDALAALKQVMTGLPGSLGRVQTMKSSTLQNNSNITVYDSIESSTCKRTAIFQECECKKKNMQKSSSIYE